MSSLVAIFAAETTFFIAAEVFDRSDFLFRTAACVWSAVSPERNLCLSVRLHDTQENRITGLVRL